MTRSLRIAVADDEPDMRDWFQTMLPLLGHQVVVVAENGYELVEKCRDASPELVITDIKMPDMDGIDAATQLYQEKPVPVILVSAYHDPELIARAEADHILGYLVKPIKQSELLDAIMTVLGSSQEVSANDVPDVIQGRRLRVLLAEDNPVNQRVARTILEKAGHEVTVAHNGREALARTQAERFDVILMDVQMPEMDGLEATKAIRGLETGRGGRVPIVGVTAHAMKGDRERCLGAGMDGYLPKPIRPAALFAAIEAAVGQSPSPPPVEAAANEMVLDEASLLALVGGDSALIRELTALFLQDGPERMAEMASALDAGDRTALERAAHTLKGSAGSLCGHPAARAALYLEDLAKSGDLGEARRAHAALGDEVRKLQDALADLARRHAA